MRVTDIMTRDAACCMPDSSLSEVARMMVENDCGEIPVLSGNGDRRPVGVVTDRDIVCRAVALGMNPLEMAARDCMSSPVITVTPDMSLDECCQLMEEHQVRRVPVIDARGACCGMVAQADIALNAPRDKTAEVVQSVSQTTGS